MIPSISLRVHCILLSPLLDLLTRIHVFYSLFNLSSFHSFHRNPVQICYFWHFPYYFEFVTAEYFEFVTIIKRFSLFQGEKYTVHHAYRSDSLSKECSSAVGPSIFNVD